MGETTGSSHTPRQACTLQNHDSLGHLCSKLFFFILMNISFLKALYLIKMEIE
ncbi:hypothetical protein GCM10007366_18250 [Mammaliicoccus vitulinus]|nr:hypothetical protein GCM10007366_18250 [Mammaliicoccus vitulinus]